jgi:viroplasmin and RNaseH domain-containing protein
MSANSILAPWYVVTRGKEVGWFCRWSRVQDLVEGVPGGNQFKGKSREHARKEFEGALARGEVRILPGRR